jgi:hypothetical protein
VPGWEDFANEPDVERRHQMYVEAGLMRRTEDGRLVATDLARAFLERMERRVRRLVPVFDHTAGAAECYHRPMTLGEPRITQAHVEAWLRDANRMLRDAHEHGFTLMESMAGDPELREALEVVLGE